MKQLIEDLISALEYHVEMTRPIHSTTVALRAAKEALAKQDGQSNFCPQCEALGCELRAIKQTGKGQSCCAECGKKESDGFALYCVECMDKINSQLKQARGEPSAEFWHGVYPDGWTADRVKAEMTDYYIVLDGLPELIDHVTGGKCSKPNTEKSVIKALFDDYVNECIEEALEESIANQEPNEPVAKVCHDLDGHIGWNPNAKVNELPEGMPLYIHQQPKLLTDEHKKSLRDAFAKALTSVYVCNSGWEAWHYGTMEEIDFEPAWECEKVLDALIEAVQSSKAET